MDSSERIARLEVENAKLREERDELQKERGSLARIATSTLRALRRVTWYPAGFWIREDEEWMVRHLEAASEVNQMSREEGKWRRITIQPLPVSFKPSLSTTVPIRAAIPAEIFDLIAEFADLRTSSVLGQVCFDWLVRFAPRTLRTPFFRWTDAWRLFSLLNRGHQEPTHRSLRLECSLSLRNITTLHVSAALLQGASLYGLSLDAVGLAGSPLHLTTLYILMELSGSYASNGNLLPLFRPNIDVLSLLNPQTLVLQNPSVLRRVGGVGPGANQAVVMNASGNSIQITRAAARVISRWSRLDEVVLESVDLHCTLDDQPSSDPTSHFFFLQLPDVPTDPQPPNLHQLHVEWDLAALEVDGKRKRGVAGPQVLLDPVWYLGSRRTFVDSRISLAEIITSTTEKRDELVEKLEKLQEDVRGPLRIALADAEAR